MAKINSSIEIVASTRPGLTSMGGPSRAAIQAILSDHYADVRITIVNDLSDLEALVARRPDMVFLGMKFIPSNPRHGALDPDKIWLGHYLEGEGINYTGSDHNAIELELNKELAKRRLVNHGLETAAFQVFGQADVLAAEDVTLSYPLFIKPRNRGGGSGVDSGSLAYDFEQLQSKVRSLAADLQADALVEEYLPGREFSVGILRHAAAGYSVMPLEIIAPPDQSGARFLSGQIKVADTERSLALADGILRDKVNTLAIEAFQVLGARDYGRIDIRLDAAGTPHFLEANLLPSLLDGYGNFPKACLLNLRLAHEPMILRIINLAFERDLSTKENFPIGIADTKAPLIFPGSVLEPA